MASATDDAPARTFPFLRLPKELRLMVYEVLFQSITRTHHELEGMSKSPKAHHPCLIQRYYKPAASIVFVHEALPVRILATSRQVYSEASVSAQRALKTLQEGPKKVIVTTGAVNPGMLGIFVNLLCSTKDIRYLAQRDHFCSDWRAKRSEDMYRASSTTQIQIAVRNNFEKRQHGVNGTTEDMWSYLRMSMLRSRYDGLLYEIEKVQALEGCWPYAKLDVTFHMALMSQVEKETFEAEPLFDKSIAFGGEFPLQIRGGEIIESAEWEEAWATSLPTSEQLVDRTDDEWAEFLPVSVRLSIGIGQVKPVTTSPHGNMSKTFELRRAMMNLKKNVRAHWHGGKRPK